MLQVGRTAPVFSLPDQNGQMVNSSGFKSSKNSMLYFYLKDDTPGRTIEANDFTALAAEVLSFIKNNHQEYHHV